MTVRLTRFWLVLLLIAGPTLGQEKNSSPTRRLTLDEAVQLALNTTM